MHRERGGNHREIEERDNRERATTYIERTSTESEKLNRERS